MVETFVASSSIESPIYRAELGIKDIAQFVDATASQKSLGRIARKELEYLQGDIVEFGQPLLMQDLCRTLEIAGMPISPELETLYNDTDFGLMGLTCAFLPSESRQFVSARLEILLTGRLSDAKVSIYDAYPQAVEELHVNHSIAVGSNFRFSEEPLSQAVSRLTAINGLRLEPRIYSGGIKKDRIIWTFEASQRKDVRGLKNLYLIVSKPTRLEQFELKFTIVARLKMPGGIVPVTVKKTLAGQETYPVHWKSQRGSGVQTYATPEPVHSTSKDPKIRILFLAANPQDTDHLRLDKEIHSIDDNLRRSEYRDRFEIFQHWAVRVSDVQELLLRHKPHIIHFSGHGSKSGQIVLENDTGAAASVSADAISNLLKILHGNVRCILLNACFSATQATVIAKEIDCVIGMSQAISDESAIKFASSFYQALGYGESIGVAFELGRNAIDLSGLDEKDKPKLLTRIDFIADKITFV